MEFPNLGEHLWTKVGRNLQIPKRFMEQATALPFESLPGHCGIKSNKRCQDFMRTESLSSLLLFYLLHSKFVTRNKKHSDIFGLVNNSTKTLYVEQDQFN